ncbi:hypothetical protein ACFYXM_12495 [Streptomyces sp. NPDC002476]|uniref:hypothetical protein n=1 Tax=Streptomyces sp. NPDC002476 TaxID=3364648 RepID=UPI0036C3DF11
MDPEPAQWITDLLAKRKHSDIVGGSCGTASDGDATNSDLPDEPEPADCFLDNAATERSRRLPTRPVGNAAPHGG